jgi:hypothetical protein
MRFLADENFRHDVIAYLDSHGHDVKITPKGVADIQIASLAKKEKRVLLTNDGDFANTLRFLPKAYYGILIFRLHPPKFEKYKVALGSLLMLKATKDIKGKTLIIKEDECIELM